MEKKLEDKRLTLNEAIKRFVTTVAVLLSAEWGETNA